MDTDRARRLIRELSPLAGDDVELLGAGTDSVAFRGDGEWVVRFPLVPRAVDELAALLDAIHRFPVERARAAGASFELCKGAYHAAQQNLERELAGRLDATERACIARSRPRSRIRTRRCCCTPTSSHRTCCTTPRAARSPAFSSASIPFLLTVRWLQDAHFVIGRGGEPCLRRLHEHLMGRA